MASMNFDITARDSASSEFLAFAQQVERLEKKLKDLDRLVVEPKVRLDTKPASREVTRFATELKTKIQRAIRDVPPIDIDTVRAQARIASLKARIDALRGASLRVEVDTGNAATEIGDIRRDLERLRDTRIRLDLRSGTARQDITAIADKLRTLRDTNIKLDVRTGSAETRINSIDTKLQALKMLSPVKIEVRVDEHDRAMNRLGALRLAALALGSARPNIQVTADTAAATAQLAALLAQVRSLSNAEHTVRVRLDQVSLLGQLARIQTELNTLAGGRIEIDADTRRLMQALALARTELAALEAMDPSPTVTADTELARWRIRELEVELARIAGRQYTAHIDVDKKGAGAAKLMALVAAAGMAVAGLGSLTASAATLGGSLVSLVGLAPLLVGGLAAGGAAAAALKVGLLGVGDALKEADPTKFAEALKGLAPEAQSFARAVREVGPAWKSMQLDTQNRLFAGLGAEMQKLSGAYLPSMRSGLGGIADQFNGIAKDVVGFATSAATVRDVDTIFRNTGAAMAAARPAATNLLTAFRDIAVVGTGMLPGLASGFTNVTGRFRDFIAQARQSGQLEQWIRGGLDTLKQLGSVAGNVGSVLGSVFTAAKASGADFLTTLDRVTEGVADFMRSGEGQNALVAFFTESRAAIDSVLPGLATLGRAAADMLQAFSETEGLRSVGTAISELAAVVGPLIPELGELAGDTLGALAEGGRTAADVLGPLVSGLIAVLDATGPIAPTAIAMLLAFAGAAKAAALVTALGVRVAALATTMGASALAGTRITSTFAAMGRVLPVAAAGLIAVGLATSALHQGQDKATAALLAGGQAQRDYEQANDSLGERLLNNTLAFLTFGAAADAVSWETSKQGAKDLYDAMSPLEKAQTDATRATNDYNLAVKEFGASSPQARSAASGVADAMDALAKAQGDAAKLTQTHTDALKAQADQMSSQIGSALAYEQAVRATADAQKAAAEALKAGGANSDQYKTSVLDLASAMSSQADAARAQAVALGAADGGLQAYNNELLRSNDGSQAGRDAFIKLASSMDEAGLKSLSAAAQMSGLKTEILTLPDGRTVTVVVAAERGQLDSAKTAAEEFARTKYTGVVQIIGDGVPFRDGVMAAVTFANGQKGFVQLDANDAPVRAKIGDTKYTIDATTGVMTIDGNTGPGDTNLTGLKLRVDSTTGVMTLDANDAPANGKLQAVITLANGSKGTVTLDGNPTMVNGKIAQAVTFADGSKGTITVDGNPNPATGKVNATVSYANGSTGTITINARDLASPTITRLKSPTSSTHTVYIKTVGGNSTMYTAGGRTASAGATGMLIPAQRYEHGGIARAFATGGIRPFRAGTAQVFPPRRLRITGDRTRDDEFYLPDDAAPKTMALGGEWARRRNMALVPRGVQRMASGGMVRAEDGSMVPTSFYSGGPIAPSEKRLRFVADAKRLGLPTSGGLPPGWAVRADGSIYSTAPPTRMSAPVTGTAVGRADVAAQIRAAIDQFRATLGGQAQVRLDLGPLIGEMRGLRGEIARSSYGPATIAELRGVIAAVNRLAARSRSAAAQAQGSRVSADMGAWA